MRIRLPGSLYSIRWRLSLAQSAVIFLCTGICMLTAFIFLQRSLTERASNDLQQTLKGASGYVEQEKSRLQGAAELISTDPEIGAAVTRRTVLIDKLAPYSTAL